MSVIGRLDRTDFRILTILQENAWTSTKELAARINLSLSATSQRVKTLKDEGHLIAAHAVVNEKTMNMRLEALILIQLDKHDGSVVEEFLEEIIAIPEVKSAFLITGRYDIVVNVGVCDTDHLKQLAFECFTNRPYITKIETSLVYDSIHSRVMTPLVPRTEGKA
ncbi:Lrp/AsnC family transcriptional regulator [Aestuariispira ectoiniformans]|uniref:Lrp/AsnC family transcriptional regulator n=1 Tax=Aestuariispira ectoiniformans TaxID=2775080 RepID=UPI00223C19E0|nr:Lrp/AsnC family transcriptional regulator [Aestuariispira ectoiniformans]